jgi:hypothetical protein
MAVVESESSPSCKIFSWSDSGHVTLNAPDVMDAAEWTRSWQWHQRQAIRTPLLSIASSEPNSASSVSSLRLSAVSQGPIVFPA